MLVLWFFVYVGHTSVMEHDHTLKSCEVPACRGNEKSRKLRKVLGGAANANLGYGLLEAVVGLTTNSSAAFADGVHSMGDWFSHLKHKTTHEAEGEYAETKLPESLKKVQTERNLAAAAITAVALYSGAKGYESFTSYSPESPLNSVALITEMGAVAMNGTFLSLVARFKDRSLAYKDALRHHSVDTAVSAVAALSIAYGLDYVGAAVASSASLWLAYKTATGHEHNHS